MNVSCPCMRTCSGCPYEPMCGGCLEERCIHVKYESRGIDKTRVRCLFCDIHNIRDCLTLNRPPPKAFPLARPEMLSSALSRLETEKEAIEQNSDEFDWPLLIPEVSDITETTSRIGVWRDEGSWKNPHFKTIAWDMTGYLFDVLNGAPWTRDPDVLRHHDWHYILGPNDNWVENVLFVDRLPDQMAMSVPPTAAMVTYMNRIWSFYWKILTDEDAPTPWLLSHGYPSYVDWPPAWHFNLGIRMLSSLAEYAVSQLVGFLGTRPGAWFVDMNQQTRSYVSQPFTLTSRGARLMWDQPQTTRGPKEMNWVRVPEIIPFVPGSDASQIAWFAGQLASIGYNTIAIDSMNTAAHENFRGLHRAIDAVTAAGARNVIVYGPWPLHAPSTNIPTENVSYIPSACHMDLTNRPPRFWRKRGNEAAENNTWFRIPSYKKVSLSMASSIDRIGLCGCPPCKAAKLKETDPRSIWRWGHLLRKGIKWDRRMREGTPQIEKPLEEHSRLWFQGPSYTVFRRCLHYPPEARWDSIETLLKCLVFTQTKMYVQFPDGQKAPASDIHWTWWSDMHEWAEGYPSLGS